MDTALSAVIHEAKEVFVVEEQLRGEEGSPGVGFNFEAGEVVLHGWSLGMFLWIGSSTEADIWEIFAQEGDEVAGVARAVGVGSEVGLAFGWIAA